jgi:hypothetical protein
VALSWVVRFDMRRGQQVASLVYPLDTFSMYARIFNENMSHLLIRDAQGAVHHVEDFRSFDCADTVTGGTARCTAGYPIQYHYDDAIRYIETHMGRGDSEMELILRTWKVRSGRAPVHTSDCLIAHCRVSR